MLGTINTLSALHRLGDERKGHAEPHLNVRLLAKWLMAAVAPPYCSSCPDMLTARNAFGLQCFLGASMFDINCPRESRVGTILNPNSVLRYEYCHVAVILLSLSSFGHGTELGVLAQGRAGIWVPLPLLSC